MWVGGPLSGPREGCRPGARLCVGLVAGAKPPDRWVCRLVGLARRGRFLHTGVMRNTTLSIAIAGALVLAWASACLSVEKAPPGRRGQARPVSFPGKRSSWHGYDRYDFTHDRRRCLVVAPKSPAPRRPWIWRARFFGHHPHSLKDPARIVAFVLKHTAENRRGNRPKGQGRSADSSGGPSGAAGAGASEGDS